MKSWILLLGLVLGITGKVQAQAANSIYDFTVKTIDGNDQSLSDYKGKVVMVVNTASKCGFTGQYEGLEQLYQTYKDKGLVVLAFPANNFLNQEPGTNEEIKQFCTLKFKTTFPLFAKISVKGNDMHPLYAYLVQQTEGEAISWNFNKFLINREGKIVARYGSRTEPMDPAIISAVESNL